ncbi:hypothetical protein AALD74_21225 [Lachnospiraceae bacterium 48-21]
MNTVRKNKKNRKIRKCQITMSGNIAKRLRRKIEDEKRFGKAACGISDACPDGGGL